MSDYRNLPELLKRQGLFCCWRYEQRQDKPTKVPYNPRNGNRAKSTDPGSFSAFSAALMALGKSVEEGSNLYSGIGVGLFGNLGAIDIDHCIDDNGELSEMAADIMQTMNAYTEYSPSGKGLRILFTVPDTFQYDKARYRINNQQAGLEVYIAGATNKYVTATGNTLTPGRDLEERGEPLRTILKKYMRRPERQIPQQAPREPVALDDLQLIEKARRSKGGPKFTALWSGDASSYKSRSEADQALCNILAFWTNRNPARMDRLFRQSGLMREKWDRRQSGSTYGALTIQNAISDARSGYDPRDFSRRRTERDTPAKDAEPVRPPDYSDAGNAVVFAWVYKDDLIFVDALGWLWWNGRKWERDDHKATAWALKLSARMLEEAQKETRDALHQQAEAKARYAASGDTADGEAVKMADEAVSRAKAYLTHAKTSRNAIRIKNMMELSKPSLVIKADRLDANPFDLNTPAGIVNLRSCTNRRRHVS